jgi:ubiquinone/menaquinone biosynthesis C-methylase UbiE
MTTGLLADLPATRILDIACGTGLLLKILSDRPDSPELVGIDYVPAMLREARIRLGPDATLLDADAGNLPFEDASFDLVTCTSALHYFLDSDAMFRELRRVIAPSGNVIITDWSRDFFWMKALNRVLPHTRHAHAQTFTTPELEQKLAAASFRVIRKVSKKIDWFWGLMTIHAVPE